uniref:Uncharacterized protein n=1 Tax=Spongospora subterranea TaxID=70186 RepID=A0A0H5R862_9EUKA|eukprot:CRZ10026.1 hypothetical protein [Spongospora subterranea]
MVTRAGDRNATQFEKASGVKKTLPEAQCYSMANKKDFRLSDTADPHHTMLNKKVISTSLAPKAIGPYSQAVAIGGYVFTAGQIPIDPKTSKIVEGDIQVQTRQVLANLVEVLKEAKSSVEHVVKTTVFLKDMNDFAKMNEVYASVFSSSFPARSTIQVARLPCDALLEIEAIASVNE